MMSSRRLHSLLDEVYSELRRIEDEELTIVPVTVTTAVPLDDDLRDKVMRKAEKLFDSAVELSERVDVGIIGGIVLEGRGERYDASVRAQLANIRTQLASAALGGEQ